MNLKFKKIDAIIVVILIIVAGLFWYKIGYPPFSEEEKKPLDDQDERQPYEKPNPPPISIIPDLLRVASSYDEGKHYDESLVCREWWYWSAIFHGRNNELKNWTIVISFNHMGRSDFRELFSEPDMLVVTLHGPNGEEYGGLINKERGYGILQQPTLEAIRPGLNVKFEDSWAEGRAPEWHVHVEDNDIDKDHEIIIDLDFFAPSEPLWIFGERAFEKSNSKIACYMFTGCNVTGTITIDNMVYKVQGTGHHEHSWAPKLTLINGWDWCHVTFDNGWNMYFSNFYPLQSLSTITPKSNIFGSLFLTTDNGETFTELQDIDLKIEEKDERIFLHVRMPITLSLSAKPHFYQILIKPAEIKLKVDITIQNSYDKVWKFPTYMGMKIGLSSVKGDISWLDEDGDYSIPLNGWGTSWSMRALL